MHRDSNSKYLKKKTPRKNIELIASFGLPPQHPQFSRQPYADHHAMRIRANISVSDSNSENSSVFLKPIS